MVMSDPTVIGHKLPIKAPFPWYGGKSAVAHHVWAALGDVPNYVEPFFGSGAAFLSRPHPHRVATINDADGYVANFWRALAADPGSVARMAAWPVSENDLHARHLWLVARKEALRERMESDPDYYDPKIAAWWVWGLCCWIGSGWCAGDGPWRAIDGRLQKTEGDAGRGIHRQLPHLGNAGMGIHRQRPHLGDAGMGIHRQLPHLGNYFQGLAERLAAARVCCGDWSRVVGPSVTVKHGLTGMFFDPPYSHSERDADLYATETDCAAEVSAWCLANGDHPLLRVVLAGYTGEHDALATAGWKSLTWKARGGYGSQGQGAGRANAAREVLWFSPHCLTVRRQESLLGFADAP
jgi:hypothetical protein